MWIGDSIVTLLGDGVQLVLLLWACNKFNEPVLQLGVRGSCLEVPVPLHWACSHCDATSFPLKS
jgi:hypothetical protein